MTDKKSGGSTPRTKPTIFWIMQFNGFEDVFQQFRKKLNRKYKIECSKDDQNQVSIYKKIIPKIIDADYIIADVSTVAHADKKAYQNANVMFELGIAMAYRKKVITITQSPFTDLPFDISKHTINDYEYIPGKFDDFIKDIEQIIDNPESIYENLVTEHDKKYDLVLKSELEQLRNAETTSLPQSVAETVLQEPTVQGIAAKLSSLERDYLLNAADSDKRESSDDWEINKLGYDVSDYIKNNNYAGENQQTARQDNKKTLLKEMPFDLIRLSRLSKELLQTAVNKGENIEVQRGDSICRLVDDNNNFSDYCNKSSETKLEESLISLIDYDLIQNVQSDLFNSAYNTSDGYRYTPSVYKPTARGREFIAFVSNQALSHNDDDKSASLMGQKLVFYFLSNDPKRSTFIDVDVSKSKYKTLCTLSRIDEFLKENNPILISDDCWNSNEEKCNIEFLPFSEFNSTFLRKDRENMERNRHYRYFLNDVLEKLDDYLDAIHQINVREGIDDGVVDDPVPSPEDFSDVPF
ncbi:MAG: hypothetical protein Q4C95_11795 [Planctomycetia bacterium]|nr:hypothetical protein [Planctomycetia bacterium]